MTLGEQGSFSTAASNFISSNVLDLTGLGSGDKIVLELNFDTNLNVTPGDP